MGHSSGVRLLIFKKNNPGCPCCNCPCACYPFDGDSTDSAGSKHLTAVNELYTSDDGAAKMAGSTYFKGDDHKCYEIGTEGLAFWFWLKPETECGTTAAPHFEGVVTKSTVNLSGGAGNLLDGEWGVYWHNSTSPGTGFAGILYFVAKPTGGIDYITVGQGGALWFHGLNTSDGWTFFFLWMSPDERKMYAIVNNNSTLEESLPAGQSFTASGTNDMYVGNNEGYAILGSQAIGTVTNRTFNMDNLGFCKEIGTKAEMEARATKLYNNGSGLACNKAGL